MQVARFLLQVVLGIGLTYALQRWDKGRLSREQRERAWNDATWGAVLWWFGPLSMFGWGWVTRRGKGLLLAVACVIGISVVLLGADLVFALIFGLPLEFQVFG
jgi:hypothetical protein